MVRTRGCVQRGRQAVKFPPSLTMSVMVRKPCLGTVGISWEGGYLTTSAMQCTYEKKLSVEDEALLVDAQ